MDASRYKRLKTILLEAADLSATERDRYLDQQCGDDAELRQEVEALLAHDLQSVDVVRTGGAISYAQHVLDDQILDDSTQHLPQSIAGYRIVRRLGAGGMGVVYEAEQQNPRRQVALKVIRGAAFVDEHRVRLFQREVQTLARLKHRGIAAIYEAGRTEDGQHFFAMELVRGVLLDDYVQQHPLRADQGTADLHAHLRLFLQICHTINYAHQRGIIHRDLKPSNILVVSREDESATSSSGEQAQVKILDFGLARITDLDVSMTTAFSETGKILGTLPYMSPEQARGNPDDIDLRTDVYALGVILFELLTGELPYDVRRTLIPEAVRVICEESPRMPSTLVRTLRGDLETIVMKALAKEPERRYQSALALAEDIERYLARQPILARPPSTMYQLRKLVARHRSVFLFLAALVVLLAGFGVTMSVMFGLQRQARLEAVTAATRAEAGRLVALGRLELDRSPTLAVAYTIASLDLVDSPEARRLALEALYRGPTYLVPPASWNDPVATSLDFSPDGQWLAVGSVTGGEIVAFPASGAAPTTVCQGEGEVDFVRFDARSGRLLCSSFADDGVMTTQVLTVPDGEALFRRTATNELRPVALLPDGDHLVTVAATEPEFTSWWSHEDVVVQAWPLAGGEPSSLGSLGPYGMRCTPTLDPSGEHLACAEGGDVRLLPLTDLEGRNSRLVGRHDDVVAGFAVEFAPEGNRLAAFDQSREVRVWSTSDLKAPLHQFRGEKRAIRMRFDGTGTLLATGHVDGTIAIRDLSGPPAADPRVLAGFETSVLGLAFHPTAAWFAATSQARGGLSGRVVSLWPLAHRHPYVMRGHADPVRGLAFAADGSWLATGARDGTVRRWLTRATTEPAGTSILTKRWGSINAVASDPGGRFVLTGASRPPSVQLVPLDGTPVRELAGFSDPVWAVAVSPDGRLVAAGGGQMIIEEAVVRIWDLDTDDVQVLDPGDGRMFSDLLFSPEGALLSASGSGLRSWQLTDGTGQLVWSGDVTQIALAVGPGQVFMCVAGDGDLRRLLRLDLASGQTTGLPAHGDEVLDVAVSPDGQTVVTGDRSGVVRVDLGTGTEPHLLLGHEGAVRSIAISPDGEWIASAGDDGNVRLWPMPTGRPFQTLEHDRFRAQLGELTNLRAVPDVSSNTGYRIEPGVFEGWEAVPDW